MKRNTILITVLVMTAVLSGCAQTNPGAVATETVQQTQQEDPGTAVTAPETQQEDTVTPAEDPKATQEDIADKQEAPAETGKEKEEPKTEEEAKTEEEPKTEEEQEPEDSGEEVIFTSTEDLHIDNGLFSIDIPEEFKGTYTGYYNDVEIFLSDNVSTELMDFGGFVFGIEAVADPDNYYDDHYTVLGQLESGNGQTYEMVITYPTDLQYAPAKADNYLALQDKDQEIAATIKSTDGGKYTPAH